MKRRIGPQGLFPRYWVWHVGASVTRDWLKEAIHARSRKGLSSPPFRRSSRSTAAPLGKDPAGQFNPALRNGEAEVSGRCQDMAILSPAEEVMVGRFCQRLHRGMPHSSLNGDRIESLPNCIQPANHLYAILSARLFFHRQRHREEPLSCLPEHFQQRAIVEFAPHVGADALRVKPLIQRSPQHGFRCRQQERRIIERVGKSTAKLPGKTAAAEN